MQVPKSGEIHFSIEYQSTVTLDFVQKKDVMIILFFYDVILW